MVSSVEDRPGALDGAASGLRPQKPLPLNPTQSTLASESASCKLVSDKGGAGVEVSTQHLPEALHLIH